MNMLLLIVVTILLTKISFALILDLLKRGGSIAKNYRSQEIPYGYGLVYGLNLVIILVLGTLVGVYNLKVSTKFIILVLTMTLIGIIDDTLGRKDFQGFKGHLKALFCRGQLTTGLLKMVFSFITIFYLFFYWSFDLFSSLLSTLIVLLGANLINLLDLRPGRALKGFILLSGLIVLVGDDFLFLAPILIMVLLSLPLDLKAKGMMGDVGANLLGALWGLIFIINSTQLEQLIVLSGLIVLNSYSEIYSLTNLIADNKLLNFLDQWGRE
ncbi:MAG: glycosyl transferase family 4 [Halanaerobacter sp.]